MSKRDQEKSIFESEEPEKEQDHSERMNTQAWVGLRRIGQPVIVAICLGKVIVEMSCRYPSSYHGLVIPAAAWPLVGLSVASCVNMGIESAELSIRNYVYYGLIGSLATAATLSGFGTQFFFEQLNDGFLKGVFSGTLVSDDKSGFAAGLTLGLNIMVGFHTLYVALQKPIYNLAFKK
jgi:hypothetical protein